MLKNILTGQLMEQGEFESNWQEFYMKRQTSIDKKTDNTLREEIEKLLNRRTTKNLKMKFGMFLCPEKIRYLMLIIAKDFRMV